MSQKERFELLLEDLATNFQVVIERVVALDEKFDRKIDELRDDLKQDISVVDAKVMGLAKRLDSVNEHLSHQIAEVHDELRTHLENVKLHAVPKRQVLKKVA